MDDITRELIDTVAPYIWACQDAATPEDVETLARDAVAAVLRKLARAGAFPDGYELADSIDGPS